jgi:6,7-dimethyl-8-ribityllumazine synthase
MPTYLEGDLVVDDDQRFAIVVGRFNEFITEEMLDGALDTLRRHGADMDAVTVMHVPGSLEIPVVAQKCARSGDYDAVICIGAVIRGATDHFDYVCSGVSSGTMQASLDTEVPVIFGYYDRHHPAGHRTGGHQGRKQGQRRVRHGDRDGQPDGRDIGGCRARPLKVHAPWWGRHETYRLEFSSEGAEQEGLPWWT